MTYMYDQAVLFDINYRYRNKLNSKTYMHTTLNTIIRMLIIDNK